jgi:hypothetical protein
MFAIDRRSGTIFGNSQLVKSPVYNSRREALRF